MSSAPHLYPDALDDDEPMAGPELLELRGVPRRAPKKWVPKRVLIIPSARDYPLARRTAERAAALGSEVVELKADRITGLRGETERETYARAKSTLAVVVAPPGKLALQPIPPSADWRVDLAEGCPAHCQYCYLAGSLSGPPVTRVYANLDEITANLMDYYPHAERRPEEGTTFEASCYTDPLALEHLTGALAETVAFFGAWEAPVQLRFTTKYDDVAPLLDLEHNGRTRIRFSVNAGSVTRRFEGGTAALSERLGALRRVAAAGFPVGLTVAPVMPVPGWREEYADLLRQAAEAVAGLGRTVDLTVELITHRFTPGSRDVLMSWYPQTKLEMDVESRQVKRTKFGSTKYVFTRPVMTELRTFFEAEVARTLPAAKILYWT